MDNLLCTKCSNLFCIYFHSGILWSKCNTCKINEEIDSIKLFTFKNDHNHIPQDDKTTKDYKNIIKYGNNRVLSTICKNCNQKTRHCLYLNNIDIQVICTLCLEKKTL